jgi:hypothetical protein
MIRVLIYTTRRLSGLAFRLNRVRWYFMLAKRTTRIISIKYLGFRPCSFQCMLDVFTGGHNIR